MISFIVIGRNEGKHLEKCFKSIYETAFYNSIEDYEIIYVDSQSTDNSVAIAGKFKEIKIFEATGYRNAAIGRNIGALEARGNILYFIDADMEICKEFLQEVLDTNKKLKYDVVSGTIADVEDGVIKTIRYNKQTEFFSKRKPLDGGIFIIKKSVWNAVNGMRTKFDAGEDGDLGLRLAKRYFQFIRLRKMITFHNTVNYLDVSRIWKELFNSAAFHARCVIYRDHLFNKYLYKRIWVNDKTFILLLLILIGSFIMPARFIAVGAFIYLAAILFRSFKQEKHVQTVQFFFYFIVFDVLNIIFLFTLFPRSKKLTYVQTSKELV